MYGRRSVTELSSGKYFAASLGLVTELRLGLVLGLGLGLGLCIFTDLSSGTYIDACSDFVPELSLGLGLGLRARVRVRFGPRHVREPQNVRKTFSHRAFFGEILRCELGARHRTEARVRVWARVRVRALYIHRSFFGNIHRCMLGLCPRAKSRVRVSVKS